jgi:Xaa-Pro aminopeptidase
MMLRGDKENSLERIAKEYIAGHGKDLHGESLLKYFTHGLGHHVGLDVHDATDPDLPLAAGQIVTIEPGLYIPEENLGIRIEDMLLITETGSRVMSAALPKAPADIEAALRH